MKVFITGGSSDIAQAMAARLKKQGHELAVSGSSKESIEALTKAYDSKDRLFVYNLEKPSYDEQEFHDYLENCDVLILNAACKVEQLKRFHFIEPNVLQQTIQADIMGNTSLIQFVLPHMIKRKFGRIIFISSIAAISGASRYGAYCLSKNALEGLILNLAVDYGRYNILSNTIRPGLMKTSRTERFWGKDGYEEQVGKIIPQERMGAPDDIARSLDSLIDPDSYINGQAINISGGMPLVSRYL